MKALVYQEPGKKALEERPIPTITSSTDAIVKITKTTICGTDLHILKGDVPTCKPGRILGHEGIGVVEKVGPGVTAIQLGERVLISCITADGKCEYCRKGMYSHCTHGGWILGNQIDGTQAEYVRIPYADTSLYKLRGEKIVLGGISKRGDRYMRKLLIQGARTAVKVCDSKRDKLNVWVANKKQRCGYNKAAVALANKNARMIWAIMATGECYRQPKEMA